MIIHNDRDPEVWKKPDIDQNEIERARKISSPNHQVRKKQLIFVLLRKKNYSHNSNPIRPSNI